MIHMKPANINLDHLVAFYLVATEASFTEAAERLCVTQPAVSMQIRSLEARFGVRLISVRRKAVHLTQEGRLLFPHAEQIFRSAVAAEALLKSRGAGVHLRIGIASALTLSLLPLIEEFKELQPLVSVTIKEGSSLNLLEELRECKHTLCLVADSGAVGKDLNVQHLNRVAKLALVASPDNPLCALAQVSWEDLAPYPLILRCEGSVVRNIVLEELRKRGISPTIGAEVDNVEAMNTLIRQDKGVALMFLPSITQEIADRELVVLPLDSGEVSVGIDVVTRNDADIPSVCRAFVALMAKSVG